MNYQELSRGGKMSPHKRGKVVFVVQLRLGLRKKNKAKVKKKRLRRGGLGGDMFD